MPLFSASFQQAPSTSQPAGAIPEVDPLDKSDGAGVHDQKFTSAYPPDSPFHDDTEGEDEFDLHDAKFSRSSSVAAGSVEGQEPQQMVPEIARPAHISCYHERVPLPPTHPLIMPGHQADKPLLNAIFEHFPLSNFRPPSAPPLTFRTRRESRPPPPNAHFLAHHQSPLRTQSRASPQPKINEPHDAKTGYRPPIRTSHSPSRSSHGDHHSTMDIPSSPGGLRARPHPSPSRHHGLSALSSLQGLSPMPSSSVPLPSPGTGHARSVSGESDRAGGHSRSGSVTRSLSRRQSLYHSAAEWKAGKEYADENPAPLFSRLTLVKAPASEQQGLRRRSKSSSALAPIAMSQSMDIPATSPRAPRRSFASSFNISPITPMKAMPVPHSPGGPDAVHRISTIYSADNEGRAKTYTPDEVVELARGLSSPVLMPEGGFKGAELKRRKSAGASYKRSPSFTGGSLASTPEQHPPTALEPVEYVQLDDDCLLPFVDRPAEVSDLMKHPSNEKMFTLLRATFPKDRARRNWQEISPEAWNWDEFKAHLTETDRIECPDYAWIFRARQAVRQRSVALWEKVGVCLGCDDRLLNAGGEDGAAQTWGGLEEGQNDVNGDHIRENQVWIEGLAPVDPEETAKAEKEFVKGFGEIVEDDEEASAGMTALSGNLVEEGAHGLPSQTTAQKAGSRHKRDPLMSPLTATSALPPSPTKPTSAGGKNRTKSFVGLTIISSSGSPSSPRRSPSMASGLGLATSSGNISSLSSMGPSSLPYQSEHMVQMMDRDQGSALFPSGFATLSSLPPLGRAASVLVGGLKAPAVENQFSRGNWDEMKKGLRRKQSGTGLSESAITFASESDYAHSSGYHD